MATGDLTTLANVHAFLNLDAQGAFTADDPLLSRLISAQSARFIQEIGRNVLRATFTETIDGGGERIRILAAPGPWSAGAFSYGGGGGGFGSRGYAINLNNVPVISVAQVMIDGTVVPARPVLASGDPNGALTTDGYVLVESQRIELTPGYEFTRGIGNVSITYDAGATVTGEAGTVPSGTPYTIQTASTFVADRGVTRASNGTALTKVVSAPTTGQYSVSSSGLYTFAAADAGLAVLLAYDNIPFDVEQAIIDMVAYVYRGRDRVGQNSKSINGETISFQTGPIPASAAAVIGNWWRPLV